MVEVEIILDTKHASKDNLLLVNQARSAGIDAQPLRAGGGEDGKGAVGELVGALLKLTVKTAIGPLLDVLRVAMMRDRTSAKAKVKLSNGTEIELEFSNLDVELQRLEKMLGELIGKSQSKSR
jgi:hypothetical protein